MINKIVVFSSYWPSENGQQLTLKIRNAFPNANIIEREYQERDSHFKMPVLVLKSPYLELPAHFEYNGTQLTYILFGITEAQLVLHPKKTQIEIWLNEQILKFQKMSVK